MSAVLEKKARGASAYKRREVDLPDFAENSAARYSQHHVANGWNEQLVRIKSFCLLEDDWDGDGSAAPGKELTDAALSLACFLQTQGDAPPDRVVVGVNGTILLEWHMPNGYYEIEIESPNRAASRWIENGSSQVVVSTLERGK